MKNTLLILGFLFSCYSATAQHNIWGRTISGPGGESIHKMMLDRWGDLYVAGNFFDTADFDPGPNVSQLISTGNTEGFIAKYNKTGALIWARPMGGTTQSSVDEITVDAYGNVYAIGSFRGSADFDPGPGIYNMQVVDSVDAFVVKLDSAGNFRWAGQFGGPRVETGISIALDSVGHVYASGNFTGTVDFDPGPGIYNLTATGYQAVYIVKLDTTSSFRWAKTFVTTGQNTVNGLVTDRDGNVYTTGSFFDTTDFDPGSGIQNRTPTGNPDSYISKLDSSGNYAWVLTFGSTYSLISGSINLDKKGNIYTCGYFMGTADFDPSSNVYNMSSTFFEDMFILKLDSGANFLWSKTIGGPGRQICTELAMDDSGDVYATGGFEGTADFNPGGGIYNLTAPSQMDMFVLKLDSLGIFKWARGMGTQSGSGNSICIDPVQDLYVGGPFYGTFDVNPAQGVYPFQSLGIDALFTRIAQCTSSFTITKTGNVLTAPAGYNSYQWYRNDTAIIWQTAATYTMTQNGNYYATAADANGCLVQSNLIIKTAIDDVDKDDQLSIYPNPTTGQFTVNVNVADRLDGLTITVFDIVGTQVEQRVRHHVSGHVSEQIDLSDRAKGIYLVEISTGLKKTLRKVVVQ